jgi:hypothetical protein
MRKASLLFCDDQYPLESQRWITYKSGSRQRNVSGCEYRLDVIGLVTQPDPAQSETAVIWGV